MGLAAIVVSFWDKFNNKLYRSLRAGIFSCMGLSGNKEKLWQKINRKIIMLFLIWKRSDREARPTFDKCQNFTVYFV
jgi:hypothetical protein